MGLPAAQQRNLPLPRGRAARRRCDTATPFPSVLPAFQSMVRTNRDANICLQKHGATSCTDVTGFGLIGHLVEMVKASENVSAELVLDDVPLLPGAVECTKRGIFSSLQVLLCDAALRPGAA